MERVSGTTTAAADDLGRERRAARLRRVCPLVFELGATGDEGRGGDPAGCGRSGRRHARPACRHGRGAYRPHGTGWRRPYEQWLESESRRLLVEPAGDAMDGAILMERGEMGYPKVKETI